jgi:hypothetical protein
MAAFHSAHLAAFDRPLTAFPNSAVELGLIETDNDQLKNILQIEHTRHRNPII